MNLLKQAYEMADKITDMTQNPQEALRRAGVTVQDLQKAKKWINNPIASLALGKEREKIINGLNRVEGLFLGDNLQTEQAPVSELEQMRKNLASLK